MDGRPTVLHVKNASHSDSPTPPGRAAARSRRVFFDLIQPTCASGAALAAVDFSVSNGTGFVGKGDAQLVFGWNNADLQRNAGASSENPAVGDNCHGEGNAQGVYTAVNLLGSDVGVLSVPHNGISGVIWSGDDSS